MSNYQRLMQEELDNRINATKAYIRRQERRSEDSKQSEVDLCYLEREEEFRLRAKELHEVYKQDLAVLRREEEEVLQDSDVYDE